MVRKSTSAARRSSITCSTSALLLAEPDHDAGLGEHRRVELLHPVEQAQRVEVAGARPDRRDRAAARSRDCGCRRRAGRRRPPRSRPALRRKSGVRTSIVVAGRARADRARCSATKWPAPPSSRSSRSTEVTTTWLRPSSATASATARARAGRAVGPAGRDVAEGAGARADARPGSSPWRASASSTRRCSGRPPPRRPC